MSDDDVRSFLQSQPAHTAKVATVRADGRSHVAPVWFALDTAAAGPDSAIGNIVFTTGEDTLKGKTCGEIPG